MLGLWLTHDEYRKFLVGKLVHFATKEKLIKLNKTPYYLNSTPIFKIHLTSQSSCIVG